MRKHLYPDTCVFVIRKSILLALAMVIFSFSNHVSAQCYNGGETSPNNINPSVCNPGSFDLGAGAYYYLPVNIGTYYDFSWTNSSCSLGFCAGPANGSGSSGSFSSDINDWY